MVLPDIFVKPNLKDSICWTWMDFPFVGATLRCTWCTETYHAEDGLELYKLIYVISL